MFMNIWPTTLTSCCLIVMTICIENSYQNEEEKGERGGVTGKPKGERGGVTGKPVMHEYMTDETIAYETFQTKEPTPHWAKRIKEFVYKSRPKHPIEMLHLNESVIEQQRREIQFNVSKDPDFMKKEFDRLDKLKGTTYDMIDSGAKTFTWPDMGAKDYDVSASHLNMSSKDLTLESDYDKLKAKYDPWDIVNNKSIDWDTPTYDDEMFDAFVKKRIVSEERKDNVMKNDVFVTEKLSKNELKFASKWQLPIQERQANMSLYNTWIYADGHTIIPNKSWIKIEDLPKHRFDELAAVDLDKPLENTQVHMPHTTGC